MKDNWISVKDRLPEYGVDVLVCCMGKGRGFGAGTICIADYGQYENGGNYFQDDRYDNILWPVTHWQPLPEQPKES